MSHRSRVDRFRKRFRRFSLSSWSSNHIVRSICHVFRASAERARVVMGATGQQYVGMGNGQMSVEPLEQRHMLSAISLVSSYSQDFDTLVNTGSSTVLPAGWELSEADTNANTSYTAGTGSLGTGDTYSFGAAASTERALGGLQSGTLVPTFGASFQNATGRTITDLTINFTGEQWRLGDADANIDRLNFQYSLDAMNLTTGTWTDVDALDFVSPENIDGGPLDGNDPANQSAVSHTLTGLNIPAGATFFIRWTDLNVGGADDGLAVDDFSIDAGPITTAFVDAAWSSLNNGDVIADADSATAGNQPAVFGENAFALIQDAVDAVEAGGTVNIAAGTYSENVAVNKAGLTLLGANSGISAGVVAGVRNAESVVNGIFDVTAPDATIDGFTITGGQTTAKAGILLNTGSDVGSTTGHFLQNNIIQRVGVTLPNSQGIVLKNGYNAAVSIADNEVFDWTTGFFLNAINPTGSVVASGNYLHDNVAGIGSDNLANATISDNLFENNTEGIGLGTPGTGIVISDNEFVGNPTLIGYYGPGASVDISGITGNYAAIDGGSVYSTIQAAVTAASSGATINVGAGTYEEFVTITKSLNLLGSQAGVDARTGRTPAGPAETTIDGSGLDGVIRVMASNATVTIDGFTLQSDAEISVSNGGFGAAITTVGSSNLTGLEIVNNVIQSSSIGITPQGDDALIQYNLIQDITIPGPAAGTGIYTDFGLSNSTIDSNKLVDLNNAGINITFVAGTGNVISNNEIVNAAGSGIYLHRQSNSQVLGNTIAGNVGITLGGDQSGIIISNNEVSGVASGQSALRLRNDLGGPNANVTATNNKFLAGADAYGVRPGSGSYTGTLTLTDNQISGGVAAIQNDDASLAIDASSNYWGTTDAAVVAASILGVGSANVDFTPLLNSGDADLGTVGFQVDRSLLTVHALGTQTGATGRVQEGVNLVDAGGTINVLAGTYTLTASMTLDKSLSIVGPNAAVSPVDDLGSRVPEAIIDGNGGTVDGVGPVINTAAGITSLTVDGLTFTNFDGNLFASSLVPITEVNLRRNIFDDNNGGLFYKFDTSVATEFDIQDNLISNHSMTGINTALFFLGNVANSTFDSNKATNVAQRELFNIYHTLTDSSFNDNELVNTAHLVGMNANASNVQVNDNKFNTIAGGALYVSTYIGQAVSDIEIKNNEILNTTGIGIHLITANNPSPPAVASISNVVIDGNTISGTGTYGLAIDTSSNDDGTISDITVTNNTFTNNTFGPILAYSRTNPIAGLNTVQNLTIDDNEFNVDASIYGASFYLIDMRNIGGVNSFSGNEVTLTGALPGGTDAIRAFALRGSRTGTWNITNNELDGGGVVHNNTPTVFVSGVAILSEDATTGSLPSTAVINITDNIITGFEDGIVVRDGVAPVGYGNLAAGLTMNVNNNDLTGNSLFAIRTGAAGETIDASSNYWGSSDPSIVVGMISTSAAVDFTALLDNDESVANQAVLGFQADVSSVTVHAQGMQIGATGRIQEGIDTVDGGGTVHITAGTYAGDVDATAKAVNLSPGSSPGQVVVEGDLTLDSDDTLTIELDGTNALTEYDNFLVDGNDGDTNRTITLGGATLALSGTHVATYGDTFTLINNDGTGDAVNGTFASLPEGSVLLLNSQPLVLSYAGGDGNDVTLSLPASSDVWVNDTWLITNDIGPGGLSAGDTVMSDTGSGDTAVSNLVFGIDAFSTVNSALSAVAVGGTIHVLAGTYAESLSLAKDVSIAGQGDADVTINAGLAFTGITVASGFDVSISGVTLSNFASTGIRTQGNLDLADSTIDGGFVGVWVDGGSLDMSSTIVSDSLIFGVQVAGLTTIADSEIIADANSAASVVVSASTALITGSKLTGGQRGLLVNAVGSAAVHGSDLSGNSLRSVENATASIVDASGNWWGSNVEAAVQAETLGLVDFTPYLNDGTDGNGATRGFGADNSHLHVTALGSQTSGGRIQEGIALVDVSGLVDVNAGTFVENVVVNKTVEIAGAGQGVTTVLPSFVGANTGGGSIAPGSSNIFLVEAHNVELRDLTVDGNNPMLNSGVLSNGVDVDARNGIITNHTLGTFNGLNIHDVTVQNIYLRGIYASSGGTFSIVDNTVTNVAGEGGSIAIFNWVGSGLIQGNMVSDSNDGIAANHSSGTQFLNNIVTNSGSGVHTDNAGDGGGTGDVISGNTVSNGSVIGGSYGVWVFVPYLDVEVSNNIVTNVDAGLGAFGGQGGTATFTGNTVDTSNRPGSVGAWVTTDTFGFGQMNVTAVFDDANDIMNADTGIYVQENSGATASVTISGAATSIHDNVTGIEVNGGTTTLSDATIADNTTGVVVSGTGVLTVGSGASITGGTTGLLLDGGTVGVTGNDLGDLSISGQSGDYITLANGAFDDDELDGSDLTLGGVAVSSMNFAQLAAAGAKITDELDDNTLGLVDLGGIIVVTPATVPSPTDNDYLRIKNAIEAAEDGDQIQLLGTFDWTEIFASASWALGNDGASGGGDDYSIVVPVGLDNVTFTAAAGLGSATIQGPEDLATVNLEGVLVFDGGDNQFWTISDLRFLDFDLSIGFFNGAGGIDAFNNTTITNNYIRVPADINTTAAPADPNQNIGIHYSFGDNQTISNNTIELVGNGVSDGTISFSSSVGIQSNTSGSAYEGLLIDNNTINVTGTLDAQQATFLGIWENGHGHTRNITVSNNDFFNLTGNNAATNLMRAFRVTSHSSGSSTVTYSDNTVDGANIGFQWLAGSNFAGHQPVVMTDNILTDIGTGYLVQSNGSATISGGSVTGASGIGVDIAAGSSATVSGVILQNLDVGIRVGGSATISGNVFDNANDNLIDVQVLSGATSVLVNSGNTFGGDDFFIDNLSTLDIDLTTSGSTFDEVSNFRIEDKMHHELDDDLSLGNGLITWVAGNLYVTAPGVGSTDSSIQRGIDVASADNTVNVESGTYVENININKNLTLLSDAGRASTTIQGISEVGAAGTLVISGTTTDVNIGGPSGNGFTIEGIDNGLPGIENGAIYILGSHSGTDILWNDVVAMGDLGLITEFGATMSGTVIDNNIFSGQTFIGANPAGTGSGAQFSLPNVPRPLVFIGNPAIKSNITFTNNDITGVAGGISLTDNTGAPAAAHEQGNLLVNIDATGSLIDGNEFAGTTNATAYSLRARGTNNTISNNVFNSSNMGATTADLFVNNTGNVIQGNTFSSTAGAAILVSGGSSVIGGDGIGEANDINGYSVGIWATAGNVLIEGNDLTGNQVGIRVSTGAIVDAGSDNGLDGDPTGLGNSAGGNILTGYTGAGGNYAIEDLNLAAQSDVYARFNDFGPYANISIIENYVFDDTDDPTRSEVIFAGALNNQPAPNVVFVNDDWLNTPLGTDADGAGSIVANWTGIGGIADGTEFGVDQFASIQDAINAVAIGGSIYVFDGTYTQELTVDKAVSLFGFQAGVDARSRVAATESVIDALLGGAAMIEVSATGVTVDGFSVDGTDYTRAIRVNGVDNAVFRNNIISGAERGIQYNGAPAGNSGGLVELNRIENLNGLETYGVLAFDASYASVLNNDMTGLDVGIFEQYFYQPNGIGNDPNVISGNDIAANLLGYGTNERSALAAVTELSGNVYTIGAGGTGVQLFNIYKPGGITLTNETINISGAGIGVYAYVNGGSVSIADSSITGDGTADSIGVQVTNYLEAFNSYATSFSSDPSFLTISNSSISNVETGVLVEDADADFPGNGPGEDATGSVTVTITNDTNIFDTTTGVLVSGSAATAILTNNDNSIHDNAVGIDVIGGSVIATNNNIYDNGIGVRLSDATGDLTDNNIDTNYQGVSVLGASTLTLTGGSIDDNESNGLIVVGDGVAKQSITVDGTTFSSNSTGKPVSAGHGDITLFNFAAALADPSTASFKDVIITSDLPDYAIQVRGVAGTLPFLNGTTTAEVTFENVDILGTQQRFAMLIQQYADLSDFSFTDVTFDSVALGGLVMFDTGSAGVLDLGNTTFHDGYTAGDGPGNGTGLDIATSLTNVDATGVVFLDSLDVALDKTDLQDNFAIEDRVAHAIDAAAPFPLVAGLIDWVGSGPFENAVFVTQESYVPGPPVLSTTPSIQRGINAATAGDDVWVEGGAYTYTENLSIVGKDVNLLGETGNTPNLQPAAGGNLITINGSGFGGDGSVVIDNFNLNGLAGLGDYGIRVLATSSFQNLTVSNSTLTGFDFDAIEVLGDAVTGLSVLDVDLTNLSFSSNGLNGGGGTGDVQFFGYNGDATLTNLDLVGSATATTGARLGIQFRGASAAGAPGGAGVGVLPMGTIVLNDIDVSGDYRTQMIGIQRYADTDITFTDVKLGGVGSEITGTFGASLRFDAVGFGSIGTPITVDLGNTLFRGLDGASAQRHELEFAPDNGHTFLRADATGTTWNIGGTDFDAADLTVAQGHLVEDRILHYVDKLNPTHGAYKGFADIQAGKAFINDDADSALIGDGSIQRGVDIVSAGGTVQVEDGSFTENVTINKNVNLLSQTGRASTTIQGISGVGALGTIVVTGNTTDVNIGGVAGEGFTIIGIDNGAPGIENAALYFQGAHSGADIRSNDIVANGDAGLLTEFGHSITGFVIDNNIFSGQTFIGTPADNGFANQFTTPNVPRQLVVMGSGAGSTQMSGLQFTNNQITGTAGGVNGGGEQGNSLVTLDGLNTNIAGNTFSGTTTRFGSSLRARGANNTITDNVFNSGTMGANTVDLYVNRTGNIIQGNMFSSSAGTAIQVDDLGGATIGGSGVGEANTITDYTVGILVSGASASALIDSNTVSSSDLGAGIVVSGGKVLAQGNDLNDNAVGVLIQNGGVADLGQAGAASPLDYTGLGISTGGNDFSGYTAEATAASGAIVNLNTGGAFSNAGPQGYAGPEYDVAAFGNLWDDPSLSGIENVVWHDADNSALGFIDYASLANLVVSLDVLPAISTHEDMNEGGSITVYGEFINDAQAHTVTISWGDGSPDTVVNLLPGVYTFTVASPAGVTYTDDPNGGVQFIQRNITVTVEEDANMSNFLSDTSLSVDVNNVAPDASLSTADGDVNEGQVFSLDISAAVDPGDDTISSYRINWGDGTNDVFAGDLSTAVNHTHTYQDGLAIPNVTITLDLFDDDGTWNTVDSLGILVRNVDPTAGNFFSFDAVVDEGDTTTVFFVGPFTDPGNPDTPFRFAYDFDGDGIYGEAGELGDGTYAGSVAASMALVPAQFLADDDDSPRTVNARIIDNDGGFTEYQVMIAINNVAPDVNAGADTQVFAGSVLSHSVTFTDPGADSPWTVNIDWDGDTVFDETFNVPAHSFDIADFSSWTYGPGDVGMTFTVTVEVDDNDGGVDSDMFDVTVVEDTLRVVDIEYFASGFDITFNRAIDIADLNLYDGNDVSVDLPDLTVEGDNLGFINGSITWNAATNTLTWVKTGGVLAADNYTVTLVSDSVAFEDTMGNLLDGDGDFDDNELNDDFVDTFSVAASADRVVSIRDFARGAGQDVNLPATGMDIPITIDQGAGVTAVDVDVVYDPALLNITGVTLGSGPLGVGGWTITPNFVSPGLLKITISGTNPLAGANLQLIRLNADVPNSAPYADSQVIRLNNLQVNEGAIGAKADFAVHKAAYLGDADGNGIYTGFDSALISRVVVLLDTGFDAHSWTDPVIVADATSNGALSGQDASLVAQEAALLDTPEIPALPMIGPLVAGTPGEDPELSVPSVFAAAGDEVTIPVTINVLPAESVFSATFDVFYNNTQLTITTGDIEQADFWDQGDGWSLTANVPGLGGQARLVFFNSTPSDVGSGDIAYLTFIVDSGATPGDVVNLNIQPVDPNEGGLTWTEVDGSIAVTYTADFEPDGDVDDDDLAIWQAGYGTQSGATVQDGDADRDGDVDGRDFLAWQRQYGGDVTPLVANVSVAAETRYTTESSATELIAPLAVVADTGEAASPQEAKLQFAWISRPESAKSISAAKASMSNEISLLDAVFGQMVSGTSDNRGAGDSSELFGDLDDSLAGLDQQDGQDPDYALQVDEVCEDWSII